MGSKAPVPPISAAVYSLHHRSQARLGFEAVLLLSPQSNHWPSRVFQVPDSIQVSQHMLLGAYLLLSMSSIENREDSPSSKLITGQQDHTNLQTLVMSLISWIFNSSHHSCAPCQRKIVALLSPAVISGLKDHSKPTQDSLPFFPSSASHPLFTTLCWPEECKHSFFIPTMFPLPKGPRKIVIFTIRK